MGLYVRGNNIVNIGTNGKKLLVTKCGDGKCIKCLEAIYNNMENVNILMLNEQKQKPQKLEDLKFEKKIKSKSLKGKISKYN